MRTAQISLAISPQTNCELLVLQEMVIQVILVVEGGSQYPQIVQSIKLSTYPKTAQ